MDINKIIKINKVLFKADPMNLGCSENDLAFEYFARAEGIAELLGKGKSLREAIKEEFNYAFWNNCLEDSMIDEIAELLV